MLEKTAKMQRIVKFLQLHARNASCNGTAHVKVISTSTAKPSRNKTAEILTLRKYMAKVKTYDMKHLVHLAKNGTKREMFGVEKAMLAVGVEKLNSTEKRRRVHSTVRQIADEYGVNNDTSTVDEVAESLYDKKPPPPPSQKPAFPPGFNETMMSFLRNMSAKSDKGDAGVVGPDEEDDEARRD